MGILGIFIKDMVETNVMYYKYYSSVMLIGPDH
jgi:hypothetical protein